MATDGLQFSLRWNAGTISLNLGVIWEIPVNCMVMMMAEKLSDAILGKPPLEPIDADFVIRATAPGGAQPCHDLMTCSVTRRRMRSPTLARESPATVLPISEAYAASKSA